MTRAFSYRAMGADGRSRKGLIEARDEADAFARLRAQGLNPMTLKAARAPGAARNWLAILGGGAGGDLEELLGNLAVLLRTGADIRTALAILGADSKGLKDVARKILSGSSVEGALTPVFPAGQAHLGALVAAGEARGDLPAGLEAAARVLASRRLIRQQLVEALSYPLFVFVTAVVAMMVILLIVVPAIAPLLDETGQTTPIYFQVIIWMSRALQWGWLYLLLALGLAAAAAVVAYRYGGLKGVLDLWWLDGPAAVIVRGLVFGGFARGLGDTLCGGAALTDALRLSQRSVGSPAARKRLDAVLQAVRQGRPLSEALAAVRGFPPSIVKLAEVGEASGQLGPMLLRAGERAEAQALARISRLSKVLGPLLILALGLLIGALMGGVLTALTDIGSVAGA